MIEKKFTQGYYTVGDQIFTTKVYAVRRAMETNLPIQWHYFDDVFAGVNKNNLGQVSLDELYKQRALQLRDKYDYLVLYYSGGADSWNILNTFLKHKIKLDCVFVWRAIAAADRNIYIPNGIDISGANYLSEWDLVIKKDLDWLAQQHPEITIEIGDWSVKIESSMNKFDELMDVSNCQCSIATTLKYQHECQYAQKLSDKGKLVARILGIERPKIVEKDGNCYFYFIDVACISVGTNEGLEYFYISPDFPLLTIEQSYQLFMWYKFNLAQQNSIKAWSLRQNETIGWSAREFYIAAFCRESMERHILYPEWDMNKFQASKTLPDPLRPAGIMDWELPLMRIPEFGEASKKWKYHWDSVMGRGDRKKELFLTDNQLAGIHTKWHYLA